MKHSEWTYKEVNGFISQIKNLEAENSRLMGVIERESQRLWDNFYQATRKETTLGTIYENLRAALRRESTFPPECNKTTNSPCEWSGTPKSEDRCIKCGVQFPEWC